MENLCYLLGVFAHFEVCHNRCRRSSHLQLNTDYGFGLHQLDRFHKRELHDVTYITNEDMLQMDCIPHPHEVKSHARDF